MKPPAGFARTPARARRLGAPSWLHEFCPDIFPLRVREAFGRLDRINEDGADDKIDHTTPFLPDQEPCVCIRGYVVPGKALMDIVSSEKRSRMMAGIKGKNTRPELAVRKLVYGMGFRYRLHRKDLPGSPDLVFPRLKKVIFVHGCFWHRHPGCRFAYTPKSNARFWLDKLEGNMRRDAQAEIALKTLGWQVLIIWECEVADLPTLTRKVSSFLTAD